MTGKGEGNFEKFSKSPPFEISSLSDILYLINSRNLPGTESEPPAELDGARISFIRGHSRLALRSIDAMLRGLDPSDRGYLDIVALRLLIVAMTGEDAESLIAEAGKSYQTGSTALDVMTLCLKANECWYTGDLVQGLWLNQVAVEQACNAAPIWKFYANFLLAKRLIDIHVPYQADRIIQETREIARSAGLFVFGPMPEALEAVRHWQEGRLDEAERSAQLTVRLSRQYTSTFGVKMALSVLAMVSLGRADWAKTAEYLEVSRTRPELYGMPDSVGRAECGEVALVHARSGPRAAAEQIRARWDLLGIGSGFFVEDPARPAWLISVAVRAGDVELGERLLGEIEHLVEINPGVAVLRTAADSARAAMAGDRLELPTVLPPAHPATAPAASPGGPDGPDGPGRPGGRIRQDGQNGPGGQGGRDAPDVPDVRRTAPGRAGTGAVASTSDASALVARLTRRELEIARLVGRGMTNQGAAQQLGLSPHTVSFHLRNVFRKLSVSTRVRLSTIMLQAEPDLPGGAAPGSASCP
ncbi:LuxR C-terminal-related transcriptional regulator [Streptomyces sp. NPDC057496]|uniref:helix-turn-helix transcriptional regulator n=1 Tax=Streptomyces sp. NPDC057496 TaxID=3346149 RepID=UPI00367BAA0D